MRFNIQTATDALAVILLQSLVKEIVLLNNKLNVSKLNAVIQFVLWYCNFAWVSSVHLYSFSFQCFTCVCQIC